jgi:cob(I)alamin adenosyltransferase
MEGNREQSEFNMAVSYLNRLNALFYVCDESAMQLNAYGWFHALMALYRELSTEMKMPEMNELDELQKDINEKLNTHATSRVKTGYNQISPDLYKLLHNFEMKIRKVLKESGLQIKMMDDAGRALK